MSLTEQPVTIDVDSSKNKRKREAEEEELEIDLRAPEPPSKKALRKAKRTKVNDNARVDADKTKSDPDEDPVPNHGARSQFGVWIGNLAFTTTKKDLLVFFTSDVDYPISETSVTRINLPTGASRAGKAQNKGFAYVDFDDISSLNKALELSEKLLAGRRVLIKNAKSFEGRPTESNKKEDGKAPSRKIFLGNLAFDTTRQTLEKHFAVCGSIKHVQVATFEDSGKCKGYAWIEFEQLSSAQAAMRGWIEQSRNNSEGSKIGPKRRVWLHQIEGRKLRLEYAEDPTTRYNKRYGKNAAEKVSNPEEVIEEVNDTHTQANRKSSRDIDSTRRRNSKRHGYEDDTVKRLTGAIVEGKGKKIEFD